MKHPETIMDARDEITHLGPNKNAVFNKRLMAPIGYPCDMFGIQLALATKTNGIHCWKIDADVYHQFLEMWKYHGDRLMDIPSSNLI